MARDASGETAPVDPFIWPEARSAFALDPERSHLNHGSYGAMPRTVLEAQSEWRARCAANPNQFFRRLIGPAYESARLEAAAFLGADDAGFTFVSNATTAINAALSCVVLGPGDEVIVTDHVYGAVRRAAGRACTRAGARLVVAEVDLPTTAGADLVTPVLDRVTTATRIAVIDHVTSATAIRLPIGELVDGLRERGVFTVVDAAHGPGMLAMEVGALAPDVWVGNFHKWVCAPPGCAGLWVRPEHRGVIEPIVAGFYLEDGFPASFSWPGTADVTPYLSLPAALAVFDALGWDRAREHSRALARAGRDLVADALEVDPPVDDALVEAMTILPWEREDAPDDVAARVISLALCDATGCEIAVTSWRGKAWLRTSAAVYNSLADFERLAGAFRQMPPPPRR